MKWKTKSIHEQRSEKINHRTSEILSCPNILKHEVETVMKQMNDRKAVDQNYIEIEFLKLIKDEEFDWLTLRKHPGSAYSQNI